VILSIFVTAAPTATPAAPATLNQAPTTLALAIALVSVLVALVVGVFGPLINAEVARRQRKHDLQVRQQQCEHEFRLERRRDLQRLRDVRLERLRATLSIMIKAVWDAQALGQEVGESVVDRLRESAALLNLEAEGNDLFNLLGSFTAALSDPQHRQYADAVSHAIVQLQAASQELLQKIERQPLEAG
jgi:hypothetical protein